MMYFSVYYSYIASFSLTSTGMPDFITRRLLIRRIYHHESPDLFYYYQSPDVDRCMGHKVYRCVKYRTDCHVRCAANYEPFSLSYRHEPWTVIGTIVCKPYYSDRGYMEIGFHLLDKYWGHGLCNEAMKPILEYVFREMKLPMVIAQYFVERNLPDSMISTE